MNSFQTMTTVLVTSLLGWIGFNAPVIKPEPPSQGGVLVVRQIQDADKESSLPSILEEPTEETGEKLLLKGPKQDDAVKEIRFLMKRINQRLDRSDAKVKECLSILSIVEEMAKAEEQVLKGGLGSFKPSGGLTSTELQRVVAAELDKRLTLTTLVNGKEKKTSIVELLERLQSMPMNSNSSSTVNNDPIIAINGVPIRGSNVVYPPMHRDQTVYRYNIVPRQTVNSGQVYRHVVTSPVVFQNTSPAPPTMIFEDTPTPPPVVRERTTVRKVISPVIQPANRLRLLPPRGTQSCPNDACRIR